MLRFGYRDQNCALRLKLKRGWPASAVPAVSNGQETSKRASQVAPMEATPPKPVPQSGVRSWRHRERMIAINQTQHLGRRFLLDAQPPAGIPKYLPFLVTAHTIYAAKPKLFIADQWLAGPLTFPME
jgi:hypothetical protein